MIDKVEVNCSTPALLMCILLWPEAMLSYVSTVTYPGLRGPPWWQGLPRWRRKLPTFYHNCKFGAYG